MRAARSIRVAPAVPAVERARPAWADMARETRTELRHMGVVGEMRRISDVAGKVRGQAVPCGLFHFAEAMRDAGVPEHEAQERMAERARLIVALAYRDTQPAA